MECLVPVIQETQQMNFVNKFLSVIFQQFSINTETKIIKKTSEVFGKLIKIGGKKDQFFPKELIELQRFKD